MDMIGFNNTNDNTSLIITIIIRRRIAKITLVVAIINNYSPKWRGIVVYIYRAAKRLGKYPPLKLTLGEYLF